LNWWVKQRGEKVEREFHNGEGAIKLEKQAQARPKTEKTKQEEPET